MRLKKKKVVYPE